MSKPNYDEPLFTTEEAARFLRLAPSTLATWRVRKSNAIPFFKFGRIVLYPLSGLEDFKRKCLRRSTAEYRLPANDDTPEAARETPPDTGAKIFKFPGAGEDLP